MAPLPPSALDDKKRSLCPWQTHPSLFPVLQKDTRLRFSTSRRKLAPLPLSLSYVGDTLCVQCVATSGSGERIALYVDAQQPDTRLERLLIGPGSPPQSFDVGHRRLAVRRLLCMVGRREGERTIDGRIRAEFVGWLNRGDNRDRVRAVRAAHAHHGGTGAFYLLLRRRSSASSRSLRATPQR